MATAEGNSFAPPSVMHFLGGSLLVARILHGAAFQSALDVKKHSPLRAPGFLITTAVTVIAAGICVFGGLKNL
eukprot:gene7421-554_t